MISSLLELPKIVEDEPDGDGGLVAKLGETNKLLWRSLTSNKKSIISEVMLHKKLSKETHNLPVLTGRQSCIN